MPKWSTQDDNKDATVRVGFGRDQKSGQDVTEIIVADKAASEHHHIGIDESGGTVFETTSTDGPSSDK